MSSRATAVLRRGIAAPALISLAAAPPLAAQTEYRSLDAGRPLRVEDAMPAERGALDLQLAPARLELLPGGRVRWQASPKLAYGVLPRTELEVRAPLVYRERGAAPRAGLAGVGVGFTHAFNVETLRIPALAVGGEVFLPVGAVAAPRATASVKGIVTRSFRFGRVHLNGSYGTYAQLGLPVFGGCPNGTAPGAIPGSCLPIPTVPPFDPPCRPAPESPSARSCAGASSGAGRAAGTSAAEVVRTPTRTGGRWLAGVAVDRTWALRGMLIGADLFAEQFTGLGFPVDWTAEAGVRYQLSPRLTADAGAGRRFAGATRAWFVTAGLTRVFGIRALTPRAPAARRG